MTTHTGSCHCGTVKFTFTLDPPLDQQEVVNCNCSICTINGYLLVYTQTTSTQFHHSEDQVKAYRFGSKSYPHYFCVNCGSSVYARCDIPEQNTIMAVNVRTIPDIDISSLKLKQIDGRSI